MVYNFQYIFTYFMDFLLDHGPLDIIVFTYKKPLSLSLVYDYTSIWFARIFRPSYFVPLLPRRLWQRRRYVTSGARAQRGRDWGVDTLAGDSRRACLMNGDILGKLRDKRQDLLSYYEYPFTSNTPCA